MKDCFTCKHYSRIKNKCNLRNIEIIAVLCCTEHKERIKREKARFLSKKVLKITQYALK